jgi:hypothetical protein
VLDIQDRQHEERYKNRWYGKYRAFVRDNHDPERLGRCRLEVPAVLGTGKDNWSEWASPCFPYGGNDDVGMFFVPEEGASVWAEFEGGQVQYPIWVGVWLARSNPGEQPHESKRLCESPTCQDCEDAKEHIENPDDLEHKKYHAHPPFYCPRRKVLFKSETGHTIVVDDKDGEEFLRIIDRAGQIIEMLCPVKPESQAGNAMPRGTRDAVQGNQLNAGDMVGGRASIEIADLSRQTLRFEAWKDEEKIHIQSCNAGRSRWQKILLDTTKEREKIHVWGLNGEQYVLIDSTKDAERIQVKDKAGSDVILDATSGNVVVRSANMVLINP